MIDNIIIINAIIIIIIIIIITGIDLREFQEKIRNIFFREKKEVENSIKACIQKK